MTNQQENKPTALQRAEKAYRDHIDGRPMKYAITAYLNAQDVEELAGVIADSIAEQGYNFTDFSIAQAILNHLKAGLHDR